MSYHRASAALRYDRARTPAGLFGEVNRGERSRALTILHPLSLYLSPSIPPIFRSSRLTSLSPERQYNGAIFAVDRASPECCSITNCTGTKTGFYSRAGGRAIAVLFRRDIARLSD